MNDYTVVVEFSALGQSIDVEVQVSARDEDDAIQIAQEKVRDNSCFYANSAELDEE